MIPSASSFAKAGLIDADMYGIRCLGLEYTGPPVVRMQCTMSCLGGCMGLSANSEIDLIGFLGSHCWVK